jgi:hypothetical protein
VVARRGPLGLAAGAVALLVACGGAAVVDRAALEDAITQKAAAGGLTVTSVDCPSGRELREGDTFTCSASIEGGGVITMRATQTDGSGGLALEQLQAVIDGPAFAAAEATVISRDYGIAVTLDCPDRVIVADGGSFACTGTDDRGRTRTVTFTAGDAPAGDFTYVVEGLAPPTSDTTAG